VAERLCSNCATQAAPNDKFCPSCGQALADQPGAATGEALVPPPPPPPPTPVDNEPTMMAFVPPPEQVRGEITPLVVTAGNTAFIPPPESASAAPARQEPVVPPPPSVTPPPDGTQMAWTPPPVAPVTPPPTRQASVFSQTPSSTAPQVRQSPVLNQPPAGAAPQPAPRQPNTSQRRFVPPTQSTIPGAPVAKKSNTGCIIAGCAGLLVVVVIIVLVVVLAVIPAITKVTSNLTPAANGTQVSKITSKTPTPAAKGVGKSATPKKTAAVTTNKAGIAVGALKYSDNFTNPKSGWDEWETANSKAGYESGNYVIEVYKVESFFWSNPKKDFSDLVLEVDATKQAGPDDNGFGVILRYADENNFYRFDVSSDGFYSFGYFKNDSWTSLIDWTEHSAIKQGNATNIITIVCKGNQFTFYINGTKIDDITDSTFSSGDIGLWAGAVSEAGVKISFGNMNVWAVK
jgi:hypothetical protein